MNHFTSIVNSRTEEHELGAALSPLHFAENWHRRARQSGAKLVATYGELGDITSHFFTAANTGAAPFRTLIPSPSDICYSGITAEQTDGNDAPCNGWLGICADQDYIDALALPQGGATYLARQAAMKGVTP